MSRTESTPEIKTKFLQYAKSLWDNLKTDKMDRATAWTELTAFEQLALQQATKVVAGDPMDSTVMTRANQVEMARTFSRSDEALSFVRKAIATDTVFRSEFLYATEASRLRAFTQGTTEGTTDYDKDVEKISASIPAERRQDFNTARERMEEQSKAAEFHLDELRRYEQILYQMALDAGIENTQKGVNHEANDDDHIF